MIKTISIIDQVGLENLNLSMIGKLLELFNPILIKIYYFYQHYQSLYGLLSINIKNFYFIH